VKENIFFVFFYVGGSKEQYSNRDYAYTDYESFSYEINLKD
jgi:hypothetical protein